MLGVSELESAWKSPFCFALLWFRALACVEEKLSHLVLVIAVLIAKETVRTDSTDLLPCLMFAANGTSLVAKAS